MARAAGHSAIAQRLGGERSVGVRTTEAAQDRAHLTETSRAAEEAPSVLSEDATSAEQRVGGKRERELVQGSEEEEEVMVDERSAEGGAKSPKEAGEAEAVQTQKAAEHAASGEGETLDNLLAESDGDDSLFNY
tara:strand:- start:96 stop:497 length:402 start_codon:yes stop_codon:yes gene_type:complete